MTLQTHVRLPTNAVVSEWWVGGEGVVGSGGWDGRFAHKLHQLELIQFQQDNCQEVD